MSDVALTGANIQKTVLDAASDALGLAILVCDKNDEIVFASRHLLQFYPISASLLQPGTRIRDFLGAVFDSGVRNGTVPERSRRRSNRDEWISEHISFHWRERYETIERIGRQRWISVRKRRISSGLCFVAISDISDQKKREEQIQTDLERVELTEGILDSMPNPMCVKDRNLNYIAVNKAFCAIHGMTAEAILGRSVWDLLEPEFAEKFERSDRAVLETGVSYSLPEQLVRADGEDLWVVTHKYRVGEAGKHLVVTCMSDVTDVVVGNDDSENAPSRKVGFKVKDYDLFEPGQNCYDPFRALDMQHLVEPGPILDAMPQPLRHVLVATSDPNLEQRILSKLREWQFDAGAISNLSELAQMRKAVASAGLSVDLLLIDAGMKDAKDIAAGWETLPSLLLPTDWTEAQLHTDILRIGEIAAEATEVMPLVPEDWDIVVAPEMPLERSHSDVEVVVAEDNEINQFVFAQILEGLGISYRIAANGEEAVTLWQQCKPNLILMDVAMPVMNGFDAARAIREAEKSSGTRTPIIAVTAQALDIDIERSLAAGMDDHITKPISPDMIEAVYRAFVPEKQERPAVQA
ncbi:response regulator [Pararhizobium antarcticum]|uniref:Two-component system response regulator n=1 Tax=Pararhizobium antarcticum TaxID=1798805 RepID=A0A657LX59_9HYPH|nr:response regulator [Pararhizobium antarcticum]OJF90396.1 two-component system response regulator [Rhizobium sp. 58]OJG00542.1 two-component system response regulator [Pararhizobium antarcticum]